MSICDHCTVLHSSEGSWSDVGMEIEEQHHCKLRPEAARNETARKDNSLVGARATALREIFRMSSLSHTVAF